MFTSAAAAAQNAALGLSAPGAGQNDWNEEPNVHATGCVPYALGDPAGCHPADGNGIDAARSEPTLVLQAKLNPYFWPATVVLGTWSGVGLSGLANPDANNLLDAVTRDDYILAGVPYGLNVFHGTWHDVNGDGFRDDAGHWRNSVDGHDRQVYLNLDGRKACDQEDPSVDPNGKTRIAGGHESDGNLAPGLDVPVGVYHRCTTPDEWTPPDGWDAERPPEVVGYLAPSTYVLPGGALPVQVPESPELRTPCPIAGVESHAACADETGQRTPDFAFTASHFYGEGTYSWDLVFAPGTDGSLVETRALTVISSPAVSADGPLSRVPGAASLVDVDVFSSVDPTVETLYHALLYDNVGAAADVVLDPVADAYEQDVCPVLTGVCGVNLVGSSDPVTGPERARFFRPESDHPAGVDYVEAPHLYLNLHVVESAKAGLMATAGSAGTFGVVDAVDADTQDTGQYCPDLSGANCGSVARLMVDGYFGIWQDKNADGFIGNPAVSEGCPDAYNCGATQDPNEDPWRVILGEVKSTEEWTPLCLPTKTGHNHVTLTTDDGTWGPVGAYVTYDEESNLDSAQGARAQFRPYDDVVVDASDGNVDRLVTSGPIELLVVCVSNNGYYYSWEEVIVPGLQSFTGITMESRPFTLGFEFLGVPADEDVQDTDHEGRWRFA